MVRLCLQITVAAILGVLSVSAVLAQPFELFGIRSGLEQSPTDFVAGVIEFRGEVRCEERSKRQLCWVPALVIDEIASRPASRSPRGVIRMLSGSTPGTRVTGRTIVFAVPYVSNVYKGTHNSVYGPNRHKRFRELIEKAVNGRRSI